MIKINSLDKYFNRGGQNEIHVLNGVTLELPDRGMVSIFGRSGCGKTTLLNVIGGLDSCHSGSVEIGGERITTNSDALRNRHIGYIFQNYNLNASENCFDNVADALRLCGMSDKRDADVIRERTMSALSAVGMAQYASRYPDTLSGGQKQRIAIARAIVKSPSIILADEPTGNLDETNTVMIMNILREIAQTRLVLLVTHEANLVDSYCDRVIGITDGRITSVKENDISQGYAARNKNHIYLGEFEKHSSAAEGVRVDYYGETSADGIRITVVNDGGKYYLRVDTPGVHVVDDYCETKLHEGTFEKLVTEEEPKHLDLSLLTSFEGKRYGKLFSFFSSLKSGSKILTGKRIKRGKKVLKRSNFFAASYLITFALVFTILLSYCASGISLYDTVSSEVNRNMFYLALENIDEEKLAALLASEEACVDLVYSSRYLNTSGDYLRISTGIFETFDQSNYEAYRTESILLPHSLIGDARVIAGSIDKLGEKDVVLSVQTADLLLKTATLDYISDYDDLINCNLTENYYTDVSNGLKIAAVVDSGELAVYYNELTLSNNIRNQSPLSITAASCYGIELDRGEAIIGCTSAVDYVPAQGELIKVSGVEVSASRVLMNPYGFTDYSTWLQTEGIRQDTGGSHYEELESYYSHLEDYALYCLLSGCVDPWLPCYFIGGNDDALFVAAGDLEYFAACRYREKNGSFPAQQLSEGEIMAYSLEFGSLQEECYRDQEKYYDFDSMRGYPVLVYLSDADYLNAILGYGETHPAAIADYSYRQDSGYRNTDYIFFHSSDPEATEACILEAFPELADEAERGNSVVFITPDRIVREAVLEHRMEIISSAVALGIGMLLMCICIYFIMRSSMLSKIREIGIYRAVGVSKKNMIFKFAVESAAIALQTLAVGFAAGAYIASSLATGGITSSNFYFPFWLGALTLAFLIGTCILFGILPIASLLRKTPAQILAKYDI